MYALALFGLGSMIYALGRFKISADHFKKLSVTDPLTHLLNRAGIREVAATYFSNPTLKQHTGIMLLDIDHFKRINDQYGHDAGDAILVQFAELIRRNMRKGDYLGRWGGEEFLLICPSIDAHNLKRIADKLVHVVAIQRMRSQGHTLQVTTSIGFSMVAGNENLDATIAAADKALYLAKAKRNIAVSAQART